MNKSAGRSRCDAEADRAVWVFGGEELSRLVATAPATSRRLTKRRQVGALHKRNSSLTLISCGT